MLDSWQGKGWKARVLYSKAGIATQVLISTLECDLLVDVGDGTLRDLLKLNYDFNRIKAVSITHDHYDHVGGLWALLGFLRMIGRTSDLLLVTPDSCRGVRTIVNGFAEMYRDTTPFQTIVKELKNKEKITVERMEIQGFGVIHRGSTKVHGIGKRIPAYGYSISFNGQRIVVSGDSGMCQSLKAFVKGADLAILEATTDENAAENLEVHLSAKEATKIGETAKELILVHRQQ